MQNTLLYILALEIDTLQTFGLIRDPKRRSYCLVQAKLVFSNRLVIVWMGTQYEQSSLHQPKVLTNTRSRASGKNSLGMQTFGLLLLLDGCLLEEYFTSNLWFGTASRRNERKEKTWENSSNSFQDLDPGNGQPKVGLSFLS